MLRRNVLALAALAPFAAACAASSTLTPAQTLAQDAQLISTALTAAVASLDAITTIPAADLAKVRGYLSQVQALAQQIATAATNAAGSLTQSLIGAAQAILAVVAPLGLPPLVIAVFQAAVSMAPTLLAEAGITGGAITGGSAKPAPVYSVVKSRAILAGAANT